MKEITSIKTRTFISGNYRVDIIEKKDLFEAWLFHKDSGIKKMMFGSPKKSCVYGEPVTFTFDMFMQIVENNLPEYKEDYTFEVIMQTNF